MLGKLLKYELKAQGRILLPLYLLLLIVCAGLSFSVRQNDILQGTNQPLIFLTIVLGFLFVGAILVTMIMTVVLILQRFYRNLLGNEGYMMFSLPVSTAEHILSKGISALVFVVLSFVVGGACALIMVSILGDFPELWESFKTAWTGLFSTYTRSTIIRYGILSVALFLAGVLQQIGQVYAAISLGHQWSDHRLIGSFLAYLGLSILEGLLFSLMETGEKFTQQVTDGAFRITITMEQGMLILLVAEIFFLLFYHFLTWWLLSHRLNLE